MPNAAIRNASPNGTPHIASGMILLRKKLVRIKTDAIAARFDMVILAIMFEAGLTIG
jgi:hypothetical protein